MPRFPYQFFDEYVFRNPLFSYKKFKKSVDNFIISNDELRIICSDSIFQEAIYLASPFVYNELIRWLNSENDFSSKDFQKLKNTILKYYSRSSTRCTPFGLFSEVGLGHFTNEINQQYSDPKKIRDTKLDMYFLIGLTQHFLKIPELKNKVLFFPNNSIYQIGNKIRYFGYEQDKEKGEYIIFSTFLSPELQNVLDFCKHGKTLLQIVNILVSKEISLDEAQEFIEELIENQILISELDPAVSGNDFLSCIISTLHKIGAKKEVDVLIEIQNKLKEVDQGVGNSISSYLELENLINAFNVEYKKNYLFQTDLYYNESIQLSPLWKKEIKQAISFLNKISIIQTETTLEKFKKEFYTKFEDREVPLSFALDTEAGIGYRHNVTTERLHPYLEDIEPLLFDKKSNLKIELNLVEQILNKKLQDALLMCQYEIELLDEDFADFKENWDNLPNTLSFMAEIVSEKDKEKLYITGGAGCSATRLLSRFCSEKAEIKDLAKTIAKKEENLNPDYILAEIIHLPEAQIGNLIRRPTLRQYEIPYLVQSVLPKENQILIEDLYISLKNNKIVLRSKKLNKEIKPYLSNAHNYVTSPLPVYHFLSELYCQNIRSGIYFNWGDLKDIYYFLPRVKYKNVILSKASWKITREVIINFLLLINNKDELFLELQNWRKVNQIPQWIQWVKSDNKLTINLENYDLVKMFIDAVKHEKSIIIEEFLFNENDDFKREFIFPMYKVK